MATTARQNVPFISEVVNGDAITFILSTPRGDSIFLNELRGVWENIGPTDMVAMAYYTIYPVDPKEDEYDSDDWEPVDDQHFHPTLRFNLGELSSAHGKRLRGDRNGDEARKYKGIAEYLICNTIGLVCPDKKATVLLYPVRGAPGLIRYYNKLGFTKYHTRGGTLKMYASIEDIERACGIVKRKRNLSQSRRKSRKRKRTFR